MPDRAEKRELRGDCTIKNLEHSETPCHPAWRGRLLRGELLLVTAPIFIFACPVIVVGTVGMSRYTVFFPRMTAKRIDAQVEEYLHSVAKEVIKTINPTLRSVRTSLLREVVPRDGRGYVE
ncbi:hypothetical protein CORC01_01488 [Colletotrichum orchidophilum]|uniref:Uncharacterized protein n=1 Tax=Colletotrichum orchidophilum TaxID=1209926 RepID=A0A1G4BNW3_9PEZI|nr:uncharacterized protein CORC01_01488 [Colletotrichum orchidophilum]OHF03104.1 hypothetical protein CORC01_01488 [Colletotrichum orchidophilum]